MTLDEWWVEIERYTEAGDRTGLLVCADGVEECGEGELAATIRWTVKHEQLPYQERQKWDHRDDTVSWVVFLPHPDLSGFWSVVPTCKAVWQRLIEHRESGVRFFQ